MARHTSKIKTLSLSMLSIGFAVASTMSMAQNMPTSGKHHFSLKGSGETIVQDEWVTSEVDLSGEHTEGRYTFLDEQWKKGFVVPPHYHKEHAETFYVVSGHVEWTVGGETHLMGPGDLVFIPPNTVHSVKVVGDETVHNLMLYDPADYERNMRRAQQYTAEEREDPKIKAELRRLGDFNPVEQ